MTCGNSMEMHGCGYLVVIRDINMEIMAYKEYQINPTCHHLGEEQ
jgi:hypothetical protein